MSHRHNADVLGVNELFNPKITTISGGPKASEEKELGKTEEEEKEEEGDGEEKGK